MLDLKLIAVQAMLTRAGTSLLLAGLLCAMLLASDSVFLKAVPVPQAVADGGIPGVVLPDPNTGHVSKGPETQGTIPLGRTRLSVPILMYHYIQDVPKNVDRLTYNLSVSPKDFNAQMSWLSLHGYHTITFDDLRAYFAGAHTLPSKPVVITLDDGYRDLYTAAYPILKTYGFKAVAYIVTSFVGRLRYVTANMILEMDANGIEIASHTVDHGNLAHMSVLSITYEVVASKRWLETLLGHAVVDFAYPSGKFNTLDETELQAAGYSTAVGEDGTTMHAWATRYAWLRTRVSGGEQLSDFIKNLGPVEPFVFAPTLA